MKGSILVWGVVGGIVAVVVVVLFSQRPSFTTPVPEPLPKLGYSPRAADSQQQLTDATAADERADVTLSNDTAGVQLRPLPNEVVSSEKNLSASFTLDAATAKIRIGNQSVKLSSSDGLFDRVSVPLGKATPLQVSIPNLVAGAEVQIAAPNGGVIKRTNGPMRFTPQSTAPVDLNLEFTPNLGRGAYTVTVRQAGAVMTFDIWAGESTPVGAPGPAWTPTPETEETVP